MWKHKKLKCGVDPIREIIKEYQKQRARADLKKVALLKELGRAAYRNPLRAPHPKLDWWAKA